MNRNQAFRRRRQDGAILITALLILLLLTIFGISTMDTNILEEKMAGNMRDRNTAFHAAESALRAAENWLAGQSAVDISDTGPIWDVKATELDPDPSNETPWWMEVDAAWWEDEDNGVVALTGGDELPDVVSQPEYIIEKLPPVPTGLGAGESLDAADTYLQITARGVGGSPTTVVVLQSIYKW